MENDKSSRSEEYLAAEKAYREQLAKKGDENYDPVMTVLLQKELNRLKRKERRTITAAQKTGEL